MSEQVATCWLAATIITSVSSALIGAVCNAKTAAAAAPILLAAAHHYFDDPTTERLTQLLRPIAAFGPATHNPLAP